MKISRIGAVAAGIAAVAIVGLASAANAAHPGGTPGGDINKTGSLADNPPPVDVAKVNPPGSTTSEFTFDATLPIEEQVKQITARSDLTEAEARNLVGLDPRNAGKQAP